MKWLFFLLLLANLALAAYFQFTPGSGNPDAKLLTMQMNADKVKILTPQQVASASAPQEAKTAVAADSTVAACVEWGNFAGKAATLAAAALARLQLGERLAQREFTESAAYWVYIPPLKTKAEAEKKIGELARLGVEEYFLVQDGGQWRNAISLGVFKTEEAAKAYLAKLQDKGVKSARTGARAGQSKQTVFVVREPGEAVTAKLVELKREFDGSELKAVDCSERPPAR